MLCNFLPHTHKTNCGLAYAKFVLNCATFHVWGKKLHHISYKGESGKRLPINNTQIQKLGCCLVVNDLQHIKWPILVGNTDIWVFHKAEWVAYVQSATRPDINLSHTNEAFNFRHSFLRLLSQIKAFNTEFCHNNEESGAMLICVTHSRQILIPADGLLNSSVHFYFYISLIIWHYNSIGNKWMNDTNSM
jgi:hypothetical protein